MYSLLPRLQAAGRCVELFRLHPQGSGRFAQTLRWRDSTASWKPATQIVVDGGEQLGWLRRTWLKWHCRRRGAGLLVTAHRDFGLPQLWRTETTTELAQRVVARLLGESNAGWIGGEQVERLFAEHRGNLREVLFALYDLYEQRRTPK